MFQYSICRHLCPWICPLIPIPASPNNFYLYIVISHFIKEALCSQKITNQLMKFQISY